MKSYILKRLLNTGLVLLGALLITFVLMHLIPGDPAENFIGQRADAKTIANLKAQWGLDQSLPHQFAKYITRVLRGDLGRSYFTQGSVFQGLVERLPFTLLLAVLAMAVGVILGLPAGIFAAVYENSLWSKLLLPLTLLGISLPVFWMGTLVLIFAGKLDTLPLLNALTPLSFNLLLASLVLGVRPAAMLSRITRTQMSEILKEDYILSARARGLSTRRIAFIHALPNALPPILTLIALDFGSLLSGAAITETIFGIPGIGKYALAGLGRRDYPVVMGMVLFCAFIFTVTNLLVDLIIPIIYPRMRREKI